MMCWAWCKDALVCRHHRTLLFGNGQNRPSSKDYGNTHDLTLSLVMLLMSCQQARPSTMVPIFIPSSCYGSDAFFGRHDHLVDVLSLFFGVQRKCYS